MKEFIYEVHSIMTIPAEDETLAKIKFYKMLHHAEFPIEIDWMEKLDEYDIED